MPIRLVLAEDSFLMREGISSLLALDDSIELVATCENYHELIAAIEEHDPDVVITDIRMPPSQADEGIQAANWVREHRPGTGVVVLSQYAEPEYALSLFERGSQGRAYLLKERVAEPGQVKEAINEVMRGGSVVDPEIVDALVEARRRQPSVLDRLTDREMEVLAEIATGRSNAAVAEALYISERAVEKHINSIFTKLELSPSSDSHRRVMAVLLYLSDTAAGRS